MRGAVCVLMVAVQVAWPLIKVKIHHHLNEKEEQEHAELHHAAQPTNAAHARRSSDASDQVLPHLLSFNESSCQNVGCLQLLQTL